MQLIEGADGRAGGDALAAGGGGLAHGRAPGDGGGAPAGQDCGARRQSATRVRGGDARALRQRRELRFVLPA